MDSDELRQWVAGQTASLAPPPEWQPDSGAAFLRMRQRMHAHQWRPVWPRRLAWSAAMAALVAAALIWPGRTLVAQFWQMLTVGPVAVIPVHAWPEGVPGPEIKLLGIPVPIPAAGIEDARMRVGYPPRLPHWGVLSGEPRISTTFSVGAATIIHTADLELALQRAGIANQAIPPQWDGARLALHSTALTIAEWPVLDLVLVQSRPITLTAPPGFDFAAFSAVILRILGVQPEEAQRLAQRAGTSAPWLLPIEGDLLRRRAAIEDIELDSGRATLLTEEPDSDGKQRISLLWMVPDRVYLLSGHAPRNLALAAANAVGQ